MYTQRGFSVSEGKEATLSVKVPCFIHLKVEDLSKYNRFTKSEVIRFLIDRGFRSLGVDLNKDPFLCED